MLLRPTGLIPALWEGRLPPVVAPDTFHLHLRNGVICAMEFERVDARDQRDTAGQPRCLDPT